MNTIHEKRTSETEYGYLRRLCLEFHSLTWKEPCPQEAAEILEEIQKLAGIFTHKEIK